MTARQIISFFVFLGRQSLDLFQFNGITNKLIVWRKEKKVDEHVKDLNCGEQALTVAAVMIILGLYVPANS